MTEARYATKWEVEEGHYLLICSQPSEFLLDEEEYDLERES